MSDLSEIAGPDTTPDDAVTAVRAWLSEALPDTWREAAERGGAAAVRSVRTPEDYRAWYPVFGRSGLVAPQWAPEHGGLGWSRRTARAVEMLLRTYHLPKLNPLGLNLAAPALFAHGSEEQRRQFLPKIVTAEQVWCQLFSEPGSGSDLASLSTRAVRDGDEWVLNGAKIWTTWADQADMAVCIARTDPDVPKHQGITYFLVDMHQPGVTVSPLRHLGGEVEFFSTNLDDARTPDAWRVGEEGAGWQVAQATLSGERQMVSGSGSGGVDRIGGTGVTALIADAQQRSAEGRPSGWDDATVREKLVRLWCEEQVRGWTNQRIRDAIANNMAPGPESSIGKVHGAELNQRIQQAAAELLGLSGIAWAAPEDSPDGAPTDPETYAATMPRQIRGMLRSRANTIEGGTSEVNKNVLAERVLGLPKDPDPFRGKPWRELPRS